jgi:hypothetical protein
MFFRTNLELLNGQSDHLNAIQKQIIEDAIAYDIDAIEQLTLPNPKNEDEVGGGVFEFYRAENSSPPDSLEALRQSYIIDALAAIQGYIHVGHVRSLERRGVWDSVKNLRNIINHPCPQNRYNGDGNAYWHGVLRGRTPITQAEIGSCRSGVSNGIVYYYKSGFGSQILTEPQGFLALTSINDTSSRPVTKEAVVDYVKKLVNEAIQKNRRILVEKKEFNNVFQLAAFTILNPLGLTKEHLSNQEWFDMSTHLEALIYLMKRRGLDADTALAEIKDLNQQQVMGISDGLKRADVIGLKQFQILTLRDLHKHGLTSDHLRNQNWFNSNECRIELVVLIKDRHISADDAMYELQRQRQQSLHILQFTN